MSESMKNFIRFLIIYLKFGVWTSIFFRINVFKRIQMSCFCFDYVKSIVRIHLLYNSTSYFEHCELIRLIMWLLYIHVRIFHEKILLGESYHLQRNKIFSKNFNVFVNYAKEYHPKNKEFCHSYACQSKLSVFFKIHMGQVRTY